MANSPSDSPSGGGPFDPEEAERLAELFQASWEALPKAGSSAGAAAPPAPAAAPPVADKAAARPVEGTFDRRGAITVPEAPAANAKRTLMGLPVPTATAPVPAQAPHAPSAPAPETASDPRAANKRTLLGVAPPAPVRGPSQSQPPPVKVPSHAPPPPPPPADTSASEPVPAAAKSSPRSSRPSGVAKVYVPKEDAHMPAVVVDQAALRDGEAAAAAEEARRRARAQASRSAKTMRARPGELGLPTDTKKRTGLWIGATLVVMLGIAGGAIFLLKAPAEPEAPPVSREATTVAPPSAPEPSIPVVPSPEALPVETAAAAASAEPPAEAPPVKEPVEAAPVAKAPAKPNKPQPANRNNSAPKRASESRPSTAAEPKKTETQKKNVIVRDTPF